MDMPARPPDEEPASGDSPLADLLARGESGVKKLKRVTERVARISSGRLKAIKPEDLGEDEPEQDPATVRPIDLERIKQRLARKLNREPNADEIDKAARELFESRRRLVKQLRTKLKRSPTLDEVLSAELTESQISFDSTSETLKQRNDDVVDLARRKDDEERRNEMLKADKEAAEARARRKTMLFAAAILFVFGIVLLRVFREPPRFRVATVAYVGSSNHLRVGLAQQSDGFLWPKSLKCEYEMSEMARVVSFTQTAITPEGVLTVRVVLPNGHNPLLDTCDFVDVSESAKNQ